MCTRREVGERVFTVALTFGVPATVAIDMPARTKQANAARRTRRVRESVSSVSTDPYLEPSHAPIVTE